MVTLKKITQQLQEKKSDKRKPHHAAILIPIVDVDDELHLLFQVRSLELKWQPGDICFPGGHIENTDLSPETAAKRETYEELGIHFNDITILGQLPSFIAELGFKIYPFVGIIKSLENISINTDEVANIFTVPIKWLINNPPRQSSMQIAYRPANDFPFDLLPERSKTWQKRHEYPIYFYHYNEYVIWGLTAKLVNSFLDTVNKNISDSSLL